MDLVSRVKNILASPRLEWPVIAVEPTDVRDLYVGYIMPLAAIPAICGFIGARLLFTRYGMPFGPSIGSAIARYVLTLIGVYIVGVIISKLAPRFGAPENLIGGLKVAAYSQTPGWVAGILLLVPSLGVIVLLAALYGLYLLYVGLPVVMASPPSNSLAYTVTIVIVAIVVYVVIAVLLGLLFAGSMMA